MGQRQAGWSWAAGAFAAEGRTAGCAISEQGAGKSRHALALLRGSLSSQPPTRRCPAAACPRRRCIPKNCPGADWRVLEEIVKADPGREKFKVRESACVGTVCVEGRLWW